MISSYKAFYIATLALSFCTLVACSDDDDDNGTTIVKEGELTRTLVQSLKGFGEKRDNLLANHAVSMTDFVRISTDSAWALSATDKQALKSIRDGVRCPDEHTLLQKVIPLEDISTYMNNKYGGTVGGFVCEAADVKNLVTMEQVYKGLRLDYSGTKFKADGAGYAVIRFYSSAASRMTIPYVEEMGGTQSHSWPTGGGGFTTSTLGDGGYPEWVCDGYNAPEEGAELYEVTPQGREILRSVYKSGRWQTHESSYYEVPQTRTTDKTYCGVKAEYKGYTFDVRGKVDGIYHLTTTKFYPIPDLQVVEKGVWGIEVAESDDLKVKSEKSLCKTFVP